MAGRPPYKPWRVYGSRGINTDYRSQRAAYEQVATLNGLGVTAKVFHWEDGRWCRYEEIAPIPANHRREAATPQDDGTFLVDCSCGVAYSVLQGGDEGAALETEHRRHAEAAGA